MGIFRRYLAGVAAILVVLGAAVTAHAHGTVEYQGHSDAFVFSPGSDQSPTDLFDGFKEVMPGDSLTQQIRICNHGTNPVKLYLRSLGAQAEGADFLHQLELTVTAHTQQLLFDAPADEPAQLTDWAYLGTFYPGAEAILDLTLQVPITMGNEFQQASGSLDWQFQAEEIPDGSHIPDTADCSRGIGSLILLMVGAGSAGSLMLRQTNRKTSRK